MGTRLNSLNRAVLTCTHDPYFEQKKRKKYEKFSFKNFIIFTAVKNCCMLHECVFVMQRMLCGNQTLCFLFCVCIRKFVN